MVIIETTNKIRAATANNMLLIAAVNCIFLIDDLNSELDPHSRHLLLDDLIDCKCQVFLTNISEQIDIPDRIDCKYINISTSITPDS